MAERPLVSVGVPVYNGEATIRRALDSLLAQDMGDFEVIVCDNASTDATPDIAEAYAARDDRVQLHRNPENLGLAGNFNRTVELARGPLLQVGDPRRLARARVAAPHRRGDASATPRRRSAPPACRGSTSTRSSSTGGCPSVDLLTVGPGRARAPGGPHDGRDPPACTGLLRTDLLRRTHRMRSFVGSDRTLIAELALLGPIVQIPEVLHFYTVPTDRVDYRPSLTYDPANAQRLPLRTWRLISEHLAVVARSRPRTRRQGEGGRHGAAPLRGRRRPPPGRRDLLLGPDPDGAGRPRRTADLSGRATRSAST